MSFLPWNLQEISWFSTQFHSNFSSSTRWLVVPLFISTSLASSQSDQKSRMKWSALHLQLVASSSNSPWAWSFCPFFSKDPRWANHTCKCVPRRGKPKETLANLIPLYVCEKATYAFWGVQKWKWCVNILWVLWFFIPGHPLRLCVLSFGYAMPSPATTTVPWQSQDDFTYFTEALQTHSFHQWREPLLLLTPLIIVDSNSSSAVGSLCLTKTWLPDFFLYCSQFFCGAWNI